jgi:hypothetical protein
MITSCVFSYGCSRLCGLNTLISEWVGPVVLSMCLHFSGQVCRRTWRRQWWQWCSAGACILFVLNMSHVSLYFTYVKHVSCNLDVDDAFATGCSCFVLKLSYISCLWFVGFHYILATCIWLFKWSGANRMPKCSSNSKSSLCLLVCQQVINSTFFYLGWSTYYF